MKYKKLLFIRSDDSVYKNENGMFVSGYASRYNNADSYGDVLVMGAFTDTIDPDYRKSQQLGSVKLIKNHDYTDQTLGVIVEMEETEKGLWFKARINNNSFGKSTYEEFKNGALDSFSIGYNELSSRKMARDDAVEAGYNLDGWSHDSVSIVERVELIEISAVLFAANTSATVGKKSMDIKLDAGDGSGVIGQAVTFSDGGDEYTGIIKDVLTEAVETNDGVIEPEEGDPILKVAITVDGESGPEETGDIVYMLASVASVIEEETEEDAGDDGEKSARIIRADKQTETVTDIPEQTGGEKSMEQKENTVKPDGILDEIRGMFGKFSDRLEGIESAFETKHSELKDEVGKLTAKDRPSANLAKSGAGGFDTVVDRFFKDESIRDQIKQRGKTKKFEVKSLFGRTKDAPDGTITTDDQSALAGFSVDRSLGIVSKPQFQPMIRDLMNVVRTDKASIEYVQETGFAHLYDEVDSGGTAQTDNVTVKNDGGSFFIGQKITVGFGGDNPEARIVTGISGEKLTVDRAFVYTHPQDAGIASDQFKITPETELKPQATAKFSVESSDVVTLAHWVPATRQALSDLQSLQAHVEGRLISGIKKEEERQILFGDPSKGQLKGLTQHPIHKITQGAGVSGVGDTKIDVLRRAITVSQYAGLPADTITVSPKGWEEIELTKDDNDQYIQDVVTDGAAPVLWGCRVFVSSVIPENKSIVGGFRQGATIWDREDANISITDSHKDFFTRNMIAILAEERLALTVEVPEAFVEVTFS